MALSAEPVVLTVPAPATSPDADDLQDVTERLQYLREELHLVKAQLLQTAHDDRHVRAAAYRLDDAAYACGRVLDEVIGRGAEVAARARGGRHTP